MGIEHAASPLVSVIVPMFDAESTIGRAIQSCLDQTMPNLEVIVVDDASTDAGRDIVRDVKDPRVRLVPLMQNLGPAGARNRGLDESSGTWLTVLDADDAYLPTRVERLFESATSTGHPLDVLVDRSSLVDEADGYSLDVRAMRPTPRTQRTLTAVDAVRRRVNGKPFFSRLLLEASGARYPRGIRFGEDTAFLIQLLNARGARLIQLPDALYLYTYRPDSLTRAPDRIEHLDRSFRFLVDECDLREELLTEVKRMQLGLEFDRKWESARYAFRKRDYRRLFGEVVKTPRLLFHGAKVYGHHRKFQSALRNAQERQHSGF